MSRDPAEVHCTDGTVFYGIYNATVEVAGHDLFRTREERDTFWERWHELDAGEFKERCGCRGEPCLYILSPDSAPNAWGGRVCQEHQCFLGPTCDDDETIPEGGGIQRIYRTIKHWDHPNAQWREYVRMHRARIHPTFRPVVARLFRQIAERPATDVDLDRIVVWEESR